MNLNFNGAMGNSSSFNGGMSSSSNFNTAMSSHSYKRSSDDVKLVFIEEKNEEEEQPKQESPDSKKIKLTFIE